MMIVTDVGGVPNPITLLVSDIDPTQLREDFHFTAQGVEIIVTHIPRSSGENSQMRVSGTPYTGPRLIVNALNGEKAPIIVIGWHMVKSSVRIDDELEPGGFFLETADFCYVPDSEAFTAFDTVVASGEYAERIKRFRRQMAERAARKAEAT